jgi:hypothetical protein
MFSRFGCIFFKKFFENFHFLLFVQSGRVPGYMLMNYVVLHKGLKAGTIYSENNQAEGPERRDLNERS